jgi:arginase
LARIQALAGRAYLHIDPDVLDPAEARINQFASPGGLSPEELVEIVRLVRECSTLAAAAITAYDPEYDEDGKAAKAALAIIRALTKTE